MQRLKVNRDLNGDLQEVNQKLKNSLRPWWEDMQVYNRSCEREITWQMLPAAVLAAYDFKKLDRELAISMAAIFKTVFLASSIHHTIKDDEEGQIYDQGMQFTILIGDYIFGRILKMLVEIQADMLLEVFAAMICEINEGRVMEHRLNIPLYQVLAKTRASLYGAAFLTASRMGGESQRQQELFRCLGFNLGMALELLNHSRSEVTASMYIEKCLLIFNEINQEQQVQESILEDILMELKGLMDTPPQAAVI